MNDRLSSYFEAQDAVLEAFKFDNTAWRVFPLEDKRDLHWMLVGGDKDTGVGCHVAYSPDAFTPTSIEAGKTLYSGMAYHQRHLPKCLWRTDTHTMVLVDTQCDLNVFLMVFDNVLRCEDAALETLWEEHWG